MRRFPLGLKIRLARQAAGLSQTELAHRAGISPSYLNLIEANRRAVAGGLVDRLARGLGVERAVLDGGAELRSAQALLEVAADPELNGSASVPPPAGAEDLVARHPRWADLLLRLYSAYREESQAVLALADRLNRDPFLGDSVHAILTKATSVRSAAEILDHADDLDPDERRRFLAIVRSDSKDLSATARGLADFFDHAHSRTRSATATEQVDGFLVARENHFPELEEIAGTAEAASAALAAAVEAGSSDWRVAPETRRFQAARGLIRDQAGETIRAIATSHSALATPQARELAAAALESYAAAALLMPYDRFLEAAERHRYDIDALARIFSVSFEQAAHRLATLRRRGAEGVRFAFMRSDPSGYVTKRLPLPNLALPRFAPACPLWVIYSAFRTPGVTVPSFGELPGGDRFLFFARAIPKGPAGASAQRVLVSVMLACDAGQAGRVVYGDGIDRARATAAVGTMCRLCAREACAHRQEPNIRP